MDSSYIISHRALRRVSLAVKLIDDFTGEAIEGSNARAWIENERAPIKKNGGVFVFTDLQNREYTVCAEGGFYQRQTAVISAGSDEMKSLTLRLRPAMNYPSQPCSLRIEGRAEPLSEVTAWIIDKQASLKLLSDAGSGYTTIRIYHSEGIDITGGTFRLQSADGSGELIVISGPVNDADSSYSLISPLGGSYPRIGSLLLPAARVRADKKGDFFLLLRTAPSSAKIVFTSDGERQVTREYDLAGLDRLRPELTE